MDKEYNKWNSRKFWFSVLGVAVHVGLLTKGLISESIYADIIQAIIWGYLAAQAGSEILSGRKGRAID